MRAKSRAAPWRSEPIGARGSTSGRRATRTGSTARRAPTPSIPRDPSILPLDRRRLAALVRSTRRAGLRSACTARPRPTCTRCSRWRPTGAHAGGGALLHRLLAAPAAGPRHLPRVCTPPHPPGAVHRRAAGRRSSGACSQRGQLIGGPQARVPLYVPYADIFQYQAGAGRRASRA